MAFNPGCAGRAYTAAPQLLDRELHRRYAAAVGADPGAGSRPEWPLACFAAVYLLWPLVPQLLADPEVGLELERLLHAEQEFTFERGLEFGELISPSGEVASADLRRGMAFLEFRCQGRDQGGELVASSRSLFVVRPA